MSSISEHNEKLAFFGGDGRGRLFTKLFFPQGNYKFVLNNTDPNSIVGTDAWSVMSAANHEDNNGMLDDDIHPDFTDFIIQTALFHKKIDKSTKYGTILQKLFNNIDIIIYKMFNDNEINPKIFSSINHSGLEFNKSAIHNGNIHLNHIKPVGTVNYTLMDVILAIIISIALNKKNTESEINQTKIFNFSNNTAGNALIAGNNSIRFLIDTYLKAKPFPNNKNLIDFVLLDAPVKDTIQELQNVAVDVLNLHLLIRDNIYPKLVSIMTTNFANIYKISRQSDFNYKTYLNSTQGMKFKKDFINDIKQSFKLGIEQVINDHFNSIYTTASEPFSENFIKNVYGKWNSLSEDSKIFYKTLISLEKLNPTKKWELVNTNFEEEAKLVSTNKDRYRINLKKTNIGDITPFFYNLIPRIPNICNNLYLYDVNGNKIKIDITNKNNDIYYEFWEEILDNIGNYEMSNFLRNLYMVIYLGLNDKFLENFTIFTNFNLPNTFDPTKIKTDFPNLWIDKVVRNRLFQIKNSEPSIEDEDKEDNEDELLDLVTQNTWKRAGDKLYTIKNGVQVMHDLNDPEFAKLLTDKNNCYTTGTFKDKHSCRLFMNQCLLEQNPNNIMECIKVMEKNDFAQSAKQEIKDMTPIVALNFLKRFGFRTYKAQDEEANTTLIKIEKVSSWLKFYMKTKFTDVTIQKAIENNDKILQYLKLVVEFVNANPSILNKNYDGPTEEQVGKIEADPYATKLGIPLRRDNYSSSANINMLDTYLKNKSVGTLFKKPLYQHKNLNEPMQHILMPFMGNMSKIQIGGNFNNVLMKRLVNETSGAALMESIILNLIAKLKLQHKTLESSYLNKIFQKIKLLKKMEKQMIQNIRYISEYSKLLDVFKNQKSETLSESNLKDIVNSNNNLYKKHSEEEQSMVKIINSINNLTNSEDNNNTKLKEINLNIL